MLLNAFKHFLYICDIQLEFWLFMHSHVEQISQKWMWTFLVCKISLSLTLVLVLVQDKSLEVEGTGTSSTHPVAGKGSDNPCPRTDVIRMRMWLSVSFQTVTVSMHLFLSSVWILWRHHANGLLQHTGEMEKIIWFVDMNFFFSFRLWQNAKLFSPVAMVKYNSYTLYNHYVTAFVPVVGDWT